MGASARSYDFLGIGDGAGVLRLEHALHARDGGGFQLLAQGGGVDAQFLRGVHGEFVALDAAGDALNVRQQPVDGFHFRIGRARREERARALQQIVGVRQRVAQRFGVGVFSLAADIKVGIEAAVEVDDADAEIFFEQQRERAFGGGGAGGIGVEVDDDVLAEASEQADLGFA